MTVGAPKPLWTPVTPENSQLAQFQKHIAEKYNSNFGTSPTVSNASSHTLGTYHDLWRWSVEHVPQFWYEVFKFLHIKSNNPPTSPADVVDIHAAMFPRPTWFKDTELNFAENMLFPSPEIENPDTAIAIIEASEAGVQQRITWTELRQRVALFASGLRAAGITKGDRVGGMCYGVSI